MAVISKSSVSSGNFSARTRQKFCNQPRQLLLVVGLIVLLFFFGNLFSSTPSTDTDITQSLQAKHEHQPPATVAKESTKQEPAVTVKESEKDATPAHSKPQKQQQQQQVVKYQPKPLQTSVLYHHYIKGKSGSVIQDMLLGHAFAWHENATYGGSCGEPSGLHVQHQGLLESIGLEEELRFACPRDDITDTGPRRSMIPREQLTSAGSRMWTPEYTDWLKSRVHYSPKVPDKFTIAVHIRRGDVSPCKSLKDGFNRYLPNSHYQTLIDNYMPKDNPDVRVVIFSQSKSYESFKDFVNKGYELQLDGDVTEVWKTIAVSDVAIMSRSSFSMIPAVVAKGTVVYTKFWQKPLRNWHTVSKDILEQTNQELSRLKQDCPTHNKYGGRLDGGGKHESFINPH